MSDFGDRMDAKKLCKTELLKDTFKQPYIMPDLKNVPKNRVTGVIFTQLRECIWD